MPASLIESGVRSRALDSAQGLGLACRRSHKRISTLALGAGVTSAAALGLAALPSAADAACIGPGGCNVFFSGNLGPGDGIFGYTNYTPLSATRAYPANRIGCAVLFVQGHISKSGCANAGGSAVAYLAPPEHRSKSAYCYNAGVSRGNNMNCRQSWS